MRSVGIFAGIGGFELGFARAGIDSAVLCEIDVAAQAVLRARFPRAKLLDDVRKMDRIPRGTRLLAAGFPCQDLSSVGEKRGIHARQSSIVRHVFRLLKTARVEYVILENVYFMLHLARGSAMQYICNSLERLGYNWAYRVIDAQSFGLPQRRQRVYFVACLRNDPRDILLSRNSSWVAPAPTLDQPLGFYWTEGYRAAGLAVNSIPPLKGGSTIGIPSPPAILFPGGLVGTPQIRDAERLQGFPAGWTEPAAKLMRDTVRWRLLGNAVSASVSEWLGKAIQSPEGYDPVNDEPLDRDARWPDAAWSLQGRRFVSYVGRYPKIPKTRIGDFLEFPVKPLSSKAVRGFLSRVEKGCLRFPTGFHNALEAHADAMDFA